MCDHNSGTYLKTLLGETAVCDDCFRVIDYGHKASNFGERPLTATELDEFIQAAIDQAIESFKNRILNAMEQEQ